MFIYDTDRQNRHFCIHFRYELFPGVDPAIFLDGFRTNSSRSSGKDRIRKRIRPQAAPGAEGGFVPPVGAESGRIRQHGVRLRPGGQQGEKIPEVARIIAVADTYDAMTSNRSYRSAMPQAQVRAEIERCKGSQFDPVFAEILLAMIDEDADYTMREV